MAAKTLPGSPGVVSVRIQGINQERARRVRKAELAWLILTAQMKASGSVGKPPMVAWVLLHVDCTRLYKLIAAKPLKSLNDS